MLGLQYQKPSAFGLNRGFTAGERCLALLLPRLTAGQLCHRVFFLGHCLLKLLLRSGAGGEETLLPSPLGKRTVKSGLSSRGFCLGSSYPGLCLLGPGERPFDLRLLQLFLPQVVLNCRLGCGHPGFGLRHLRFKVIILQLNEKFTGLYVLVV